MSVSMSRKYCKHPESLRDALGNFVGITSASQNVLAGSLELR
jgi:hypothetical protein